MEIGAPTKRITKEQFFAELGKASDRVGYGQENLARWLVNFSRLDLNKLSSGDLLNTQYEVQHLILNGVPCVGGISESVIAHAPSVLSRHAPDGSPYYLHLAPLPLLIEWQTKVKDTFLAILTGRGIDVQCPPLTIKVFLIEERGVRSWHRATFSDDPRGPLIHAWTQLLPLLADRIKKCKACPRIFFSERPTKVFCSGNCQNRAGTRRFREAHGLITGRKRGRPPKAAQQRSKRKHK